MAVVGILLRIGITELIVSIFIDLSVLVLMRYFSPAFSFLVECIGLRGLASVDLKNNRPIIVNICQRNHDRFLIIDDVVYLFGASLKDAGKKLFAYIKMQETSAAELLNNIK